MDSVKHRTTNLLLHYINLSVCWEIIRHVKIGCSTWNLEIRAFIKVPTNNEMDADKIMRIENVGRLVFEIKNGNLMEQYICLYLILFSV